MTQLHKYMPVLASGLIVILVLGLIITLLVEISGGEATSSPAPTATVPSVVPIALTSTPTPVPTKPSGISFKPTSTPSPIAIKPTLIPERPLPLLLPTRTPTPAPDLPQGSARVEVGLVNLLNGERGFVPITVRDITDPGGLGAYDFLFTFEPFAVLVLSVAGGDPPFGSGSPQDNPAAPIHRINNDEGWVTLVDFQASQIPGPTEDIVVAYVEVEAIGASGTSSAIAVEVRSLPNAENGANMVSTAVEGSVTIGHEQ